MMFDGWYDTNGNLIATSRNGTMIMDGSHVVEARWHQDYTIPFVIVTLLTLVAAFKYGMRKKCVSDSSQPMWSNNTLSIYH
jgi:urea transporter